MSTQGTRVGHGFVESTIDYVAAIEDTDASDRWAGDIEDIHAFLAANPAF